MVVGSGYKGGRTGAHGVACTARYVLHCGIEALSWAVVAEVSSGRWLAGPAMQVQPCECMCIFLCYIHGSQTTPSRVLSQPPPCIPRPNRHRAHTGLVVSCYDTPPSQALMHAPHKHCPLCSACYHAEAVAACCCLDRPLVVLGAQSSVAATLAKPS